VPDVLTAFWKKVGEKSHLVSEAELLPVVLCKALLSNEGSQAHTLLFIDNDGIAATVIKGGTRIPSLFNMVAILGKLESAAPSGTWVSRVPSWSNPADAPSRMFVEFSDNCRRGRCRTEEALCILESYMPDLICDVEQVI
jgi:hypothetical protein